MKHGHINGLRASSAALNFGQEQEKIEFYSHDLWQPAFQNLIPLKLKRLKNRLKPETNNSVW